MANTTRAIFLRKNIPAKGMLRDVENALEMMADMIVSNAKALAPKDKLLLTNSIHFRTSRGASKRLNGESGEQATGMSDTPKDGSILIGSNVEYAPHQEFGYRVKGGGTVAPQPYLEPAIDIVANSTPARQAVAKAFDTAFKQRLARAKFVKVPVGGYYNV